jgi:HEPN domain-containing protein
MRNRAEDEASRWLDSAVNDLESAEWDLHYLPSRYPNSLPGGVPHLFYTKAKGEEAVACAKRVLQKVKGSTLP